MNGVTLFETQAVNELIQQMVQKVEEMHKELIDLEKPYMSVKKVSVYTGISTDWVNDHKQDIGFSMVGGRLRFKRQDVDTHIQENYLKKPRNKASLPPG